MFNVKLSAKEKMGVIAASAVVTLLVMDRLIISPIAARFRSINQNIKASEKKLVVDIRNINNKDAISAQYGKYKNYVKRTAASDEEEIAAILAEIEGLARRSDVTLVDIKPQTPKQTDYYKEYIIDVDAEGDMEHVIMFMHNLNGSSQLLRMPKVRLTLRERESQVVKASISISRILI